MKALTFDKPGMDNLRFGDCPLTEPQENEVIVETKCIGINPIDYFTITGFHGTNGPRMKINPFPHIAGSEIAGIVIKKGNKTKDSIKEGDRVIIYNRIFDNTCKLCKKGYEMLCQNGGLVGVAINGGFAEYVKISDKNIIKIPDNIGWELAASLPVAGLTAFHAIKESNVIPGENMIIFGASGNTGHFCTQIGKILGARIIAISKKQWVKEYGADEVVSFDDNLNQKILDLTNGEMANIVINSLGEKTWNKGMEIIGKLGRIVTFGVLTGGNLNTDGRLLYNNQITIKGTTGGSKKDLIELIELINEYRLTARIWKRYRLEESKDALDEVFNNNKDGRIIITNY